MLKMGICKSARFWERAAKAFYCYHVHFIDVKKWEKVKGLDANRII